MIRIAVVEDEPNSMLLIVDHLQRYTDEHGETFDIRTFGDGEDIVSPYSSDFDIIFLDVQMARLDGLRTAKRIRELDSDVVLVFITNMAQYAIRGYEVDALSYLLKPVPYFAFSQELQRSIARVRKRSTRSIMISAGAEMVRLDTATITYVESAKHRITVHTLDRIYAFTGTLKEMESTLAGHDFFRSNSCYLVNLRHVTGVKQSSCVLVGSTELQVSRPRKRAFLDALTHYIDSRAA